MFRLQNRDRTPDAAMHCLDDLFTLSRRAITRALTGAVDGPADAPHAMRYAVDGTAGNGYDTLFLAENVGPCGQVWAFDVQSAALQRTAERLHAAGCAERVTLLEAGHERMAEMLPAHAVGRIRAAVFNLGFLPGSKKEVVTSAATTLLALDALKTLLAPDGVISVHCYAGHPGGAAEYAAVSEWVAALPWDAWRVTSHAVVNKTRNPECLFLVGRQYYIFCRSQQSAMWAPPTPVRACWPWTRRLKYYLKERNMNQESAERRQWPPQEITVVLEPSGKESVIPRPKTVLQLLKRLEVKQGTALVIREGGLLTQDREIRPGDRITIRTVVSQG